MGYCTRQEVERVLNQALTTATNNTEDAGDDSFVPLYEISNSTRPNAIPPSLVDQYILWADEEIDGALSEMYAVPFCEKADLQMHLLHDIGVYSDDIDLNKARNLNPGDVLIFVDDTQEERHIVDTVVNNTMVELEGTLLGFYDADNTRVMRVKYPTAITLISTRLAAANIFDKYFTAEVSPNVSDYGKHLRKMARGDLNNILHGRTVLHGQQRIGHRFLNPTLRDRYRLPSVENDASRNLDDFD
tara:strand:+ start:9386 stop:10120 length:735 start_codon:yes stop_codon:yes gene_type:complete